MKIGDLVRCKELIFEPDSDFTLKKEMWVHGVVVEEYQNWEKIVTVLVDGKVKRYHARDVSIAKRASIK